MVPYRRTKLGLPLFAEGIDTNSGVIQALCDQTIEYFPDVEISGQWWFPEREESPIKDWLDANRAEAMARYGDFGDPVSTDFTGLSLKYSNWPELESALIEALCTYARENGY